MANNFTNQYLSPIKRRGVPLLGSVGRSMQGRGTVGGLLIGNLLQAMAGGNRDYEMLTPEQQEARRLQLENIALHNEQLKRGLEPDPYKEKNASADSAWKQTRSEREAFDFKQAQDNAARLAEERKKTENQAQQQKPLTDELAAQKMAEELTKRGYQPARIVELIQQAGFQVPTRSGLQPVPDFVTPKTAATMDIASGSNPLAAGALAPTRFIQGIISQYNREGLPRDLAVGPTPEQQQKEQTLREQAAAEAEHKEVLDFAKERMKNNLSTMRAVLGLKEPEQGGDTGDDLSALVRIGGGSRLGADDRAIFNRYLADSDALQRTVLKARVDNRKLKWADMAPMMTPERVAEKLVKPPEPYTGPALEAAPQSNYRLPESQLFGSPRVMEPPNGSFQMQSAPSGDTGPQFNFNPASAGSGQGRSVRGEGASVQLGTLVAEELKLAGQLRDQGYSKDQVGAELLRLRNANTR